MRYYEDPQRGSIYSLDELKQMLRGSEVTLLELLPCLKAVPYSTCCLLEEAEAVAAQAEIGGHRRLLDR